MAETLQVRLVNVEFLRPGPPHNQLLSPLTQYLAVCGDAGAGVVTVPYEQATFERRLRELRYETGELGDRLPMLNETGVDIGRILGSVPGLSGALAIDPNQPGTIIHLRLTLSASELALLPFELAKVPVGPNATAESWLAIQTRPPVCVTRNIRTVSPEGVIWPHQPRILFVTGDPDIIPFVEHRKALLGAIQPFQYPKRDDEVQSRDGERQQFGDLLTILINPTLTEVFRECRDTRYTHVHILTHGDLNEASHDSYGLVFRGPDDGPDVVSGERFCSALNSVGMDQIHRPTVVTIASCDSGNVGSLVIPGASFAHALHQSGIPLVVASQFPLSTEGSVPLVATLYKGLLWGDHPLLLLLQIRAELHARYTSSWHDWASLVVYEALPRALDEQLDKVRYFQSKSAINAALQRIDQAVQDTDANATRESLAQLDEAVTRAVQRLPMGGRYAVECVGLRASARKRLAQATFTFTAREAAKTAAWNKDPYDLLDQALLDYDRAVSGLLINEGGAVQRVATLHWVLVQVESLSAVLGRAVEQGHWEAAHLCAERYLGHTSPEERAWAHGSLAELYLVRLSDASLEEDEQQRKKISDLALEHARKLVGIYPSRDEFPVTSTWRQFARYVDWWGTERFEKELTARSLGRRARWSGRYGLTDTAKGLMEVLQPRSRAAGSSGAPPAAATPPPAAPTAASPTSENTSTRSGLAGAAPFTAFAGKSTKKRGAARTTPAKGEGPFFDIEMLPANHGDSLWIEYGDKSATHRVLVDCGTQQTTRELMRHVESLPERDRHLELFIMSHIDSDHIGGALPFLSAVQGGLRFGDVWFNGWRHLSGQLGARQGEMFSTAIQDMRLPWNQWRQGGAIVLDGEELPVHKLPGGMTLTLLSPTPAQLRKLAPAWTREIKKYGLEPGARVDYTRFLKGTPSKSSDVDKLADAPFTSDAAVANGSSIAVLAEYQGASALLGADAHAPVLVEGIRKLLRKRGLDRLKLDAFKVPHHASQNNVSRELLALLECKNYLVSTNGAYFCHPDREAISRIIKYGGDRPTLHFNYCTKYNDVWARSELQAKHYYSADFGHASGGGMTVSLLTSSSSQVHR